MTFHHQAGMTTVLELTIRVNVSIKLCTLSFLGGTAAVTSQGKKENLGKDFTQTALQLWVMATSQGGRSEVGSGLLYWCNSRDVLQIGAVVFSTGVSVPKFAPIIGLFLPNDVPSSHTDTHRQTLWLIRHEQQRLSEIPTVL